MVRLLLQSRPHGKSVLFTAGQRREHDRSEKIACGLPSANAALSVIFEDDVPARIRVRITNYRPNRLLRVSPPIAGTYKILPVRISVPLEAR